METNFYRTIWISDLHIGSTQCQADVLLDFLKHNESEKLYLVGDIIDFWSLSKRAYLPYEHKAVIQQILHKARQGTKIIYIPGNHDKNVRTYDNYVFGNIIVKISDIHTTVQTKHFLIVHGDEYDVIARHWWVAELKSIGYDVLINVNHFLRLFSLLKIKSNFSIATFIKFKIKNVVRFISNYEMAIVKTLEEKNLDGVICGHIHYAEIKHIEKFLYLNIGDFVENCTAIVEHHDGELNLIKWKTI